MQPTVGRIVHYTISEQDVEEIARQRGHRRSPTSPVGNQMHAGEVMPMVVTAVWSEDCVNGQVLLDGNDSLWVTSVSEGEGEYSWCWPPREDAPEPVAAEPNAQQS